MFSLEVSRASAAHDEREIAVVREGQVLGGVAFLPFAALADDSALQEHWRTEDQRPGVRLARFWTNGTPVVLSRLFRGMLDYAKAEFPDRFLYGILALPLGYARKRRRLMGRDEGLLAPRMPLVECCWDGTTAASSEGRRLLASYLKMGARPLGPPSGDASDESVRVALGTNLNDVRLPAAFLRAS